MWGLGIYLNGRPRAWQTIPVTSVSIRGHRYALQIEQRDARWRLILLRPLTARPSFVADARIAAWVSQLQNDDIYWEGQYPLARHAPPEQLRLHANRAYPLLLKALDDPAKFAAAHLLLHCAGGWGGNGDPSYWSSGPGFYYGLRYQPTPDGTARYDPGQIPQLKDFWSHILIEPAASIFFPDRWWFSILPALFLLALLYRSISRLRRTRPGFCSKCGYDLRASTERCPECGEPIRLSSPSTDRLNPLVYR